jgi:membrane-bound metal-dependent hydrolase YbcI (DUF457 family)
MLGHTHVVIATATWGALWWRPLSLAALGGLSIAAPQAVLPADFPPFVASLVAVSVGALLPDIDHPQALLAAWKPLGRGGPLGLWRLIRPLLLPSLVVREVLGHRGPLHSILAGVVVCSVVEYVALAVGAPGVGRALGWGYAAHLVADMLTRRGVPLLWPFARRRIAFPRPVTVRTGGFGEALYLAATGALAALYASGVFGA